MTTGQKVWMIVGGVLAFVVGGVITYAPAADADRVVVVSTGAVVVQRGAFERLDDAGWKIRLCATTTQTDGGRWEPDEPCVTCEPGAWANGPATCTAAWKSANGL